MRRLHLHRPSAATIISLIALFFAMSGTAVAATGGNFILGKSNTATTVSSLTNRTGTALKLSSTSTAPPLTVSNSVQVPKLNASELDGQTSSAFLAANGTAANSSELGGTPASGFVQGGGTVSFGRLSLAAPGGQPFLSAPGSRLFGVCQNSGGFTGSQFSVEALTNNVQVTWWDSSEVSHETLNNQSGAAVGPVTASPLVLVMQVDTGSNIATYTATENYDSSTSTCSFTGQIVTTNG